MDEELKQLDLATAEARDLASKAIDALREPQRALREAAADHVESVAQLRIDASRHASVEVMAKLSDDDVAELRYWTEEQVTQARSLVEAQIEDCDFWIPETSGLSLIDANTFGAAFVPRPKDSPSGIPQVLVQLFERCLEPLRRGLVVVGFATSMAEAEPRLEAALVQAWRIYRDTAIECLAKWADVDERYHTTTARFQEMRWELAGDVDVAALRDQHVTDTGGEDLSAELGAVADIAESDQALAERESQPAVDAVVRPDPEALAPVTG